MDLTGYRRRAAMVPTRRRSAGWTAVPRTVSTDMTHLDWSTGVDRQAGPVGRSGDMVPSAARPTPSRGGLIVLVVHHFASVSLRRRKAIKPPTTASTDPISAPR